MNNQKRAKNLSVLGLVLLAQCILVAVLWLKPESNSGFKAEPLLTFAKDSVERVVINGGQPVTLEYKNNAWYMGDVVADKTKVEALLNTLASLQTAWPVATTADSAPRFEVAENKFQRKVEVRAKGEDLAALYFGSSPSFNRTHVRRHGGNDVYSLAVNIQDIPASQDAWLLTSVMQPSGELKSVSSGGEVIEKVGAEWQLKGAAVASEVPVSAAVAATTTSGDSAAAANERTSESATVDSASAPIPAVNGGVDAKSVVNALTQLTVLAAADNIAELDAVTETERFKLEVVTADAQWQYQLIPLKDQYYVRRNDINTAYRISKETYDELIKLPQYAGQKANP
jgi:Domain of unknown function (DUF4340)